MNQSDGLDPSRRSGQEAVERGDRAVSPRRRGFAVAFRRALLVLLGVEAILRLLPPPPFIAPAALRGRPVHLRGVRPVVADYETRTPPFARDPSTAVTRVVCCGSSSTYGLGLPPQGAWPWRLATMLGGRGEVVNLARVGACSADQVEIVRAALLLRPSVIVVMEGNNELLAIMAARASGTPLEARVERWVLEASTRSRLCGWVRALVASPASPPPVDAPAPLGLAQVEVTDDELALARETFRGNLHEMARLCSAAGVGLMLCTVPVNRVLPCPLERDRHPVRASDALNEVVKGVGREDGTLLCDLGGFDASLFLDACHFNDAGARHAAEEVASALRRSGHAPATDPGRADGPATGEPRIGGKRSAWIDLGHFGDLLTYLDTQGRALPPELVTHLRAAYQRHTSVSFALADALEPIDPAHTDDLAVLALYGHILTTAHRYSLAGACYARARSIDPAASVDLGWARWFANDAAGALEAWQQGGLDDVTQQACRVLDPMARP